MTTITKTIAQAYLEAVNDGVDAAVAAENTAKILKEKNLLGKGDEIVLEVEKLWNKTNGIVVAEITSRFPLAEKQKKDLARDLKGKYSAKEIELVEKIDESLLGGLKIVVDDEVTDSTLSAHTRKLAKHLLTTS